MTHTAEQGISVPDWATIDRDLAQLARQQIFFIGGAPRSGTTWLQQMLDAHPDVCCRGEGLFLNHFAVPLERLMAQRGQVMEGKNRGIFSHNGGYPLPAAADTEFLIGSAILLGLRQQTSLRPCHAVGEKTPENVFFFGRLKRLFPDAKFIAIARDPRDVLASAWHFFAKNPEGDDHTAARRDFVKGALPSLAEGARAMEAFEREHPADCVVVTYEQLLRDPAPALAHLFGLLGVAVEPVADCIAQTSFAAQSGRASGIERNGSFFRKGVAGDWRSTLNEEMNQMVLRELGWQFPRFAWPI